MAAESPKPAQQHIDLNLSITRSRRGHVAELSTPTHRPTRTRIRTPLPSDRGIQRLNELGYGDCSAHENEHQNEQE